MPFTVPVISIYGCRGVQHGLTLDWRVRHDPGISENLVMARKKPALPPDGDDPILVQARTIAEEFDAALDKTCAGLQRLLEGLPSIQAQPKSWPSSAGPGYAGQFLRAAYRALGWRKALRFLNATPPDVLEQRVWVTRYLAGADDYDGIPLFSRQELADQLRSFRELLLADRQHLLQTGLPSKEFPGSRWLSSRAAKLYVIKRTNGGGPYDEPVCVEGEVSHYTWVRVVQLPEELGISRVPGRQEEADIVVGIREAEADRLHDLREKILDLKIAVLAVAEHFLASAGKGDFWSQCLPLIRSALTADEAEFCMRIDLAYREIPEKWKNTHPILWWQGGYDGPVNPGGFSSIVELIGHVEKECTIGTMHQTREALGDLVVDEEGKRVLVRSVGGDEWVYFDFVDSGNVEIVDRAVDVFRECEGRETAFWGVFQPRVSSDLARVLDREVGVRTRVQPDIAEPLQLHIQTYAEWAKNQIMAGRGLPTLQQIGDIRDSEQAERAGPVILGNAERREVLVLGVCVFLTRRRYSVIEALVDAYPGTLKQADLIKKSHCGDAVNILKRMARESSIWKRVIKLGRGGYGLRYPER